MRYEEIKLSGVHRHYLKPEDSKVLFKCDGCKEDGIGLSYRCDRCNFDLHFHCAKISNTIYHPFYGKHSFKFMKEPPKGSRPCCEACEGEITGFFYWCKVDKMVNLHPCCAKLPMELDNGKMKFSLWSHVSSTSCRKCEKNRMSWAYRSNCNKKYTLHVACARKMLMKSWRNGDGGDVGTSTEHLIGVPCLNGIQAPHKISKSKKKGWKMLFLALRLMISALAGDPTALIAGVFSSIMS